MKRIMVLSVVCAVMTGCEYTAPLVTTPGMPVDDALVGLWQRSGESKKTERLLVLPWSQQELLVVFPVGSKDEMFARACLWRDQGITLVQLDWFGTVQGKSPEDFRKTFQYASYTVEGDELRLRLLNTGVVPKDIASSEALAKAIIENKDDPNLFRGEMVYRKLREQHPTDEGTSYSHDGS